MSNAGVERIGWGTFHGEVEIVANGDGYEVIWDGDVVGYLVDAGYDGWTAVDNDGEAVGTETFRVDAASFLVAGVDGAA